MTAGVRADARTPFPGSGRAFPGHSTSENRTYLNLGAKYAKRPSLQPTDSQFLTPLAIATNCGFSPPESYSVQGHARPAQISNDTRN